MKYSNLVIATIVLQLGACAQLQVSVDVLNPDIVKSQSTNDYISKNLPRVLAEDDITIAQKFIKLKNAHHDAIAKLSKVIKEKAESEKDVATKALMMHAADDWVRTFDKNVAPYYDTQQINWKTTVESIKNLAGRYNASTTPEASIKFRRDLLTQLQYLEHIDKNLDDYYSNDINNINVTPGSTELDKVKVAALADVKETKNRLFDSGNFIHSPYSYYVVNADEKEWAKFYDRSFGQGNFGNTDIAIKALGAANFTIKGLSFNPADVANMASKVVTQSVVLAAQIAGVPVPIEGTPTGDGAGLAKSSQRITTAISQKADMEIKVRNQRQALLRIVQAIMDDKETLKSGTPEEMTGAIKAIKAVYNSQLTRISISVPTE